MSTTMTLTVALSIKDGMVFATDSRGTIGDPRGLTAQNDAIKKLYVLGNQTVLQISGANETGYMIIDELLKTCNQSTMSTTEIMSKARDLLIKRYDEWFKNMPIIPIPNSGTPERPALNFTIAGFDNIESQNVAHRIYVLTSQNNFAPQLFNSGICLTGVPQYAIYLLHRLFSKDMSIDNALSLAAYVITETASQDGKVGGPLQLMSLKNGGEVAEISAEQIKQLVAKNNDISTKLKQLFLEDK